MPLAPGRILLGGALGLAALADLALLAPPVRALAPTLGGLGGIALVATVAAGSAAPGLRTWGPALCRGDPTRRAVALSFDDGPHPEHTPRVLGALAEAEARATFFFPLDRALAHPEVAREVARRHEVGLHGLSHDLRPVFADPAATAEALRAGTARLAELVGAPVRFYRPPFGVTSPRLAAALARAGLTLAWCSVRPRDGGPVGEATLRRRCARAGPGDILLLHDVRARTATLLPVILRDFRERGLSLVGIGEIAPGQPSGAPP